MPPFIKMLFIAITTQFWKLQFGWRLELPRLATNLKRKPRFPLHGGLPCHISVFWVTCKINSMSKIGIKESNYYFFLFKKYWNKNNNAISSHTDTCKDEKDTLPKLEKDLVYFKITEIWEIIILWGLLTATGKNRMGRDPGSCENAGSTTSQKNLESLHRTRERNHHCPALAHQPQKMQLKHHEGLTRSIPGKPWASCNLNPRHEEVLSTTVVTQSLDCFPTSVLKPNLNLLKSKGKHFLLLRVICQTYPIPTSQTWGRLRKEGLRS